VAKRGEPHVLVPALSAVMFACWFFNREWVTGVLYYLVIYLASFAAD
jgi:hypothetical protein